MSFISNDRRSRGLNTQRDFLIRRGNKEMTITATPEVKEERDHFGFKHNRGLLGLIGPGNAIVLDRITSVDGRRVANADQARRLLNERMGRTFKIEMGEADKKEFEKRINAYVKEIDRCIAMLGK